MFKCFMIEKKLYEYMDNTQSPEERLKVEKHLGKCADCRIKFDQMAQVIDAAKSKAAPSPSKEFWHSFKAELDQKLNARLVPPLKPQPSWRHTLKPAFAVLSVVIVVSGLYFSFYGLRPNYLDKEDLSLIEELIILDEVSSQPYLNHNEDAYIEEFYLQQQLTQNPA